MFALLCLLFCPVIACIVELESAFVPTNFLDECIKFVTLFNQKSTNT